MMKRIALCITLLVLVLNKLTAQNCIAIVNGGTWTSSASWSCGHQPTNGDVVSIPAGFTINVTTNINSSADVIQITINGVLNFNVGKLSLASGSGLVINTGGKITNSGGGGSSSLINIGSSTVWKASDGTINGYSTLGSPALKVSLVNFYGSYNSALDKIVLNGQTAQEANNNHFEILKSENGSNFSVIGIVKGKENSTELSEYSFSDESINLGLNYYYIIRAVDNNNNQQSTNSIVVTTVSVQATIAIIPCPIQGDNFEIKVNLPKEKHIHIHLHDVQNKLIYSKEFDIENTKTLQMQMGSSFPVIASGLYFLTVEGSYNVFSSKIIVQ